MEWWQTLVSEAVEYRLAKKTELELLKLASGVSLTSEKSTFIKRGYLGNTAIYSTEFDPDYDAEVEVRMPTFIAQEFKRLCERCSCSLVPLYSIPVEVEGARVPYVKFRFENSKELRAVLTTELDTERTRTFTRR